MFLKAATVFVVFLLKHANGESFRGIKNEHQLFFFFFFFNLNPTFHTLVHLLFMNQQ